MRAALVYGIIFLLPLLMYLGWLRFLRRRLGFLLLLPLLVCGVWLALWPANWFPAHQGAIQAPADDRADAIVAGFILLGWLYGLVGCLPVIVIEAIRGFLAWGAKRRDRGKTAQEIG